MIFFTVFLLLQFDSLFAAIARDGKAFKTVGVKVSF